MEPIQINTLSGKTIKIEVNVPGGGKQVVTVPWEPIANYCVTVKDMLQEIGINDNPIPLNISLYSLNRIVEFYTECYINGNRVKRPEERYLHCNHTKPFDEDEFFKFSAERIGPRDIIFTEFDKKFFSIRTTPDEDRKKDLENIFELTTHANYLGCVKLMHYCYYTIASFIKGKNSDEIREFFFVENDFTPEEDEQMRNEIKFCLENVK